MQAGAPTSHFVMLWPHYLNALFVYIMAWYCCTVQAAGQVYTEYIMFQATCVLHKSRRKRYSSLNYAPIKKCQKRRIPCFLTCSDTMKNQQARALPLFSHGPHSKKEVEKANKLCWAEPHSRFPPSFPIYIPFGVWVRFNSWCFNCSLDSTQFSPASLSQQFGHWL